MVYCALRREGRGGSGNPNLFVAHFHPLLTSRGECSIVCHRFVSLIHRTGSRRGGGVAASSARLARPHVRHYRNTPVRHEGINYSLIRLFKEGIWTRSECGDTFRTCSTLVRVFHVYVCIQYIAGSSLIQSASKQNVSATQPTSSRILIKCTITSCTFPTLMEFFFCPEPQLSQQT